MKVAIETRIEDEGRPDPATLVGIHLITPGTPMQAGGLTVQAIQTIHPPLTDACAFRFDGTQSVVFSGDTACMPPLADFTKGADLLIHEAMLEPALKGLMARIGNGDDRLMRHWLRPHTLAADAGRIAAQAGIKALALHHLIPSDDSGVTEADWRANVAPHDAGPLYVGRDGLQIEL